MTETGVFDFVNSINSGKNIMSEENEEIYNPYLTNIALSYFNDTVLHANIMNVNHHLNKRTQYTFLINSVRKRKRFSKWAKLKEPKDLELIAKHYGVGRKTAKEYADMLPDTEIKKLKTMYDTGGN